MRKKLQIPGKQPKEKAEKVETGAITKDERGILSRRA